MPAYIDTPDSLLETASVQIVGWVAGCAPEFPVSLSIEERPIEFARVERPGLRGLLGAFAESYGIVGRFDLADWLDQNTNELDCSLTIRLRAGDDEVTRMVRLSPGLVATMRADRVLRRTARDWVAAHLRCPTCRSPAGRLVPDSVEIVCPSCGVIFTQQDVRALDLRSDDIRRRVATDRSHNVSSNPYEHRAQDLIDRVVARGGWVLDCGAGARAARTRQVLNVEIEDYASTDVLSVGESLPFQDGTFDAAVSLAVLEHVRDPFACARELLRVVKPGGEIVCSVPFLQPVHGFPSHYFNMTREALKTLFANADLLDCYTPLNGHPILTLQWFAQVYLEGLPERERTALGAMTVAEAAALPFPKTFAADYVRALSADAMLTIACLNTIVVRKRQGVVG